MLLLCSSLPLGICHGDDDGEDDEDGDDDSEDGDNDNDGTPAHLQNHDNCVMLFV